MQKKKIEIFTLVTFIIIMSSVMTIKIITSINSTNHLCLENDNFAVQGDLFPTSSDDFNMIAKIK